MVFLSPKFQRLLVCICSAYLASAFRDSSHPRILKFSTSRPQITYIRPTLVNEGSRTFFPLQMSQLDSKEHKYDENEVAIATAVGGTLIGLTIGGLSDGIWAGGGAPWAPVLGAVSVGTGAYYTSTLSNSSISTVSNQLLGVPVIELKNRAILSVETAIDNARNSVKQKIKQVVQDIKALPSTVQKASGDVLDGVKLQLKRKVDDVAASINKKIESSVSEVYSSLYFLICRRKYNLTLLITIQIKSIPKRTADNAIIILENQKKRAAEQIEVSSVIRT